LYETSNNNVTEVIKPRYSASAGVFAEQKATPKIVNVF